MVARVSSTNLGKKATFAQPAIQVAPWVSWSQRGRRVDDSSGRFLAFGKTNHSIRSL